MVVVGGGGDDPHLTVEVKRAQNSLDPKLFVDSNPLFSLDQHFFRTQYMFGTWRLQLEMRDKAFPS